MICLIRPLPFKPPRLIGLSEALTADHYGNEYGASVCHLNALDRQLAESGSTHTDTRQEIAADGGTTVPATLELRREQVLAANDVLLHEVYFDSLGGEDGLGSPTVDPAGELGAALVRDYGSVAIWRDEFVAMARSAPAGWIVLSWSTRYRTFHNDTIADGSPLRIGACPLLAIDLHRHAYAGDFGNARSDYIDVFMTNLHWGRAAARFAEVGGDEPKLKADADADPVVTTIGPEQLQAALADGLDATLLDVCLPDDLNQRHDRLPGARCCRSDRIVEVMQDLPKDKPVIAYCIYGFQVSGNAMTELRRNGFDAKTLSGGLASWRAIGGVTVDYEG